MRKQIFQKFLFLWIGLLSAGLFFLGGKALATSPTTINFQGKVVNNTTGNVGTNVSDTSYTIVFRLYNTQSPTTTGSCTLVNNCLWEETDTVSTTNGVFQVELGANCSFFSAVSCNNSTPIDFSSNSLYLTMKFNGDSAGFMSPTMHFTGVPYAYYASNSAALNGLSADNFVQLAQGLQTDASSSNASIAINKTGGTANILTLQKSGSSVLVLDNNGLLTLQPAASLTSGQTSFSQSLTNASSTGGTVNGYSQTVTVSNTSSASTTNGIKIGITDATTLANITNGVNAAITDNGASGAKTNKAITGTAGGTNTGATNYGGYFTLSGSSVYGSAIYASNGATGATILQVQNNSTDVMKVTGNGTTAIIGGKTGLLSVPTGVSASSGQCTFSANPGLVSAGVYKYKVTASTGSGDTLPSSEATGTAGSSCPGGSHPSIQVSWTSVTNATSYNIYRTAASGSSNTETFLVNTASSPYTDDGGATPNLVSAPTIDTTQQLFISGSTLFQPATSLTSGQNNISQIITNASSTGGTVNGYSQTISVNNTSSASNTNGINISLTDNTNTGLANTNVGLKIIANGSNTSQIQYGIDVSVNHGTAIRGTSSGTGATCGPQSSASIGLCGDSTISGSVNGAGVYGHSTSNNGSPDSLASVTGVNDGAGQSGSYSIALSGQASQSAAGAKSIGVYGSANGVATSTIYGGYFTLGTSGATAGAALYATNSSTSANILQLQDNTTSVFTVADNGVTTAKSNSSTGFQIQDSSNSKNLFTVDTSGDQAVLGMQGTSGVNGKIQFNTTNASNTFVALAAASTASSFTLTLPTSLPSASNYCIVSTNLGVLSFSACGASATASVTLSPEFPGATMSGDGTSNVGTMTSDFCSGSGSGGISINASVCDGATSTTHNYYSWTASATNDYDIFTIWQAPSDFSSFSNLTFNAKVSTTTSDSVVLTVYKVGQTTACGSGTINTGTTWQTSSSISTASCTIGAGDKLIFDAKLTVGVTNDFARMGEINITYNRS